MWTLRLEVRVRPEKRREFLESLRTLPASAPNGPECHKTLQDVDDPSLICWRGEWTSRENLSAFMASNAYSALKGAVSILGSLRGEVVVESESATPSGWKGLEQ